MSFEQIRQKADRLRSVPLESVLRHWGALPDRHDKSKWHTSRGILSVNGAKFINWNCGTGGGGAIDLVIHLHHDGSFREALDWLHRHFPQHLPLEQEHCPARTDLRLPQPDPAQLQRVMTYLVTQRAIPKALIAPLIDSGTLYADRRANAVFLLLGTGNDATAVGAELRGTGPGHWRGMAPGSRKNLGFFSIPAAVEEAPADRRPIILCESAIDAISCFALHPGHYCISTSGARPNPSWLPRFIAQGRTVYCGFDADDTGESMAQAMIDFHPGVQRLRPACHDWNDLLKSRA
jgi:hypothetical protein